MKTKWKNYSPEFVSRRYNKLAGFYPLFELIFLLPRGIRKKAVDALNLADGSCVLEIGCGTGKNIPLLSKASGKDGIVFGVDVSPNMLRRANKIRNKLNLDNVKLVCGDAENLLPGITLHGALFSLSYAVMAHRKEILRKTWEILQPGGRIVIMDAQFPAGLTGKLFAPLKPLTSFFLKSTVLGNPFVNAIDELNEVTGRPVDVKELAMKTYFLASVTKN